MLHKIVPVQILVDRPSWLIDRKEFLAVATEKQTWVKISFVFVIGKEKIQLQTTTATQNSWSRSNPERWRVGA